MLVSRLWKSLPEFKSDILQDQPILRVLSIAKYACTEQASTVRLPPPSKAFIRGRAARRQALKAAPSAFAIELSMSSPPKIMSISPELADTFGFQTAELCGRSMSVLQGPDTNSGSLRGALKAAADSKSTSLSIALYSRDGAAREIVVQFVPIVDTQGKVSGCTMQITFPRALDGGRGAMDVSEAIAHADGRALSAEKERELRQRYMSGYRFRTGLAIQQELNRREALERGAGKGGPACA